MQGDQFRTIIQMRAIAMDVKMTSPFPETYDVTETIDQLNARYADALLPLAVLMGIFCVVGILGNALVIVVFSFSQEYKRTNFRVFVVSLGIIDLLSCFSLMPAEILKTRHYFLFSDIQCKAKCFFNVFAMNAAAFVLLVICIDRYRKVCQPLKKQIWPGLAFKLSLSVIILSVFLSAPAAIMCGIQTENVTNIVNSTTMVQLCSAEEQFQDSIVRYVYKFTLTGFLLLITVAFVVMYILIVKVIIRHKKTRSNSECILFDSSRPRRHSTDGISNRLCVNVQLIVDPNKCFSHEQLIRIKSLENFKIKFTATDLKAKRNESGSSLNSSTSLKSNVFVGHQTGNENKCGSRSTRMPSARTWKFPYKTLIWLTLTLIFLLSFLIHAGLSFLTLKEHLFPPMKLVWYQFFFRLYFVNNVINPIVYALLDRRFKASCKRHFVKINKNLCKCYFK